MNKYITIESYKESLIAEQREVIETIESLIIKVTKKTIEPKLWEQKLWGGTPVHIIGYGEYTHTYKTGKVVHWFTVGITSYKNTYSVYINKVQGDKYLPEIYAKKLGKVTVGKSCIKFKGVNDLNIDEWKKMLAEVYK